MKCSLVQCSSVKLSALHCTEAVQFRTVQLPEVVQCSAMRAAVQSDKNISNVPNETDSSQDPHWTKLNLGATKVLITFSNK